MYRQFSEKSLSMLNVVRRVMSDWILQGGLPFCSDVSGVSPLPNSMCVPMLLPAPLIQHPFPAKILASRVLEQPPSR